MIKIEMDLMNDCACVFELILEPNNDLNPQYRTKNICLTHKQLVSEYKKANKHKLDLVNCFDLKVDSETCDKFSILSKRKQRQITDFLRYILSEIVRERYDTFLNDRK